MLKALLIPSGNDAAYTIAASIGRVTAGDESLSAADAVKKFVALMNQTAAELGMSNTHFNNPDGYPKPPIIPRRATCSSSSSTPTACPGARNRQAGHGDRIAAERPHLHLEKHQQAAACPTTRSTTTPMSPG